MGWMIKKVDLPKIKKRNHCTSVKCMFASSFVSLCVSLIDFNNTIGWRVHKLFAMIKDIFVFFLQFNDLNGLKHIWKRKYIYVPFYLQKINICSTSVLQIFNICGKTQLKFCFRDQWFPFNSKFTFFIASDRYVHGTIKFKLYAGFAEKKLKKI